MNIGKKEEDREQQAVGIAQRTFIELEELGKDKYYERNLKEINLNSQDQLQQCLIWLMENYYLEHANRDEYFLDIGCGGGGFVFKMERLGYISTGLEVSIPKLYICHTLKNLYKDKRVYIYPGMGEKLPFRDQWFDVVNSTMVFENVRRPVPVLAEMLRVSKIVTGVIHQDDQIGSPYHTWHMTNEAVLGLFDQFKNGGWINKYKIEYLHEGHSKCCVFIIDSNVDRWGQYCKCVEVNKIVRQPSGIKELEDSYYEAILEYGKSIIEDPTFPIIVTTTKNGDGYRLDGDGQHRMAAVHRVGIEKIRVLINKKPVHEVDL